MKKSLFATVLIVVILTGGALAVAIWRASPISAEDFVKSGKQYYENKKYPEAAVQFLNAVQKDPDNRDARYFLAMSYLNRGDANGAVQHLRALLEVFPDDVEANLQLGNIYLVAGSADTKLFNEAATHAEKVLAKEPQNVGGLILAGNAAIGLQDYKTSVEQFEKAVGLDPNNTAAFVNLGASQAFRRNFEQAEEAFQKARQLSPNDKNALLSLASYYGATNEREKAEAMLKEALAAHPTDKGVYLQVAAFYFRTGRFEDAERILVEVQTKSKDDPEPTLVLADLLTSRNRPEEARKVLLQLKENFPDNLSVATKLGLNLMQDDPVRARQEIDQILKTDPTNPIGHILLGELQFTGGQYAAAEATFGNDAAINSPFPQPHFFLGNLALRRGEVDQAQDHYQKALALSGAYLPARVALAEIFLSRGKTADSREEIRKVLAADPRSVPGRLIKAALDRIESRFPEAEKELTVLLTEQPNNALVHRQMGLYYASRGRLEDAEKSMTRALDLQPDSEDFLKSLIQFHVERRQTDRAIQRINTVPDNQKKALHFELLGLVYSKAGKLQESLQAYKKALEKEPGRASAMTALAVLYIQSNQTSEGLKELDALIARDPSSAGPYAMKGLVYEGQGKIEEAKQSYMQALKVDANLETAANNLAYILAEEGRDLDSALTWAQAARKNQPGNANIADTLGWVYYKLGNHVLARDQLQFAVSKNPENPVFQYHLGLIYKETRQIAEAQAAFRKAAASPSNFKEKSLAQAALKDVAVLK